MSHLLSNANHTAQWYQPSYPDAEFFSRLDKFVLHTTETESFPSYDGGAKAPNATYNPRLREIRQHFYSDRSSRALQDPTSTPVRENRDNVFQLEIVCYSCKSCAASVGGLWVADLSTAHLGDIADIIVELNGDLDLPVGSTVEWNEGASGDPNVTRLTSSQYDAYKGILGHVHVSGNSHYDPGGFRYSRLQTQIEEAMSLTATDKTYLEAMVEDKVLEAIGTAQPFKSGDVRTWAEGKGLSAQASLRYMNEIQYKATWNNGGDLDTELKDMKQVVDNVILNQQAMLELIQQIVQKVNTL